MGDNKAGAPPRASTALFVARRGGPPRASVSGRGRSLWRAPWPARCDVHRTPMGSQSASSQRSME